MALDFPASSASPFTAPNGVVYTWNADGYWEAKADPNDFDSDYLKLDATNDPVTGNLALNQDLNVGDNLEVGDSLTVTGTSDFTGLTTHESGVSVTGGGVAVSGTNSSASLTQINYGSYLKPEGTCENAFSYYSNPADGVSPSERSIGFFADRQRLGGYPAVDYGFVAGDNLLGTTKNSDGINACGFKSEIMNADGRYNFFAAGSAPNYFAGHTLFGSGGPGASTNLAEIRNNGKIFAVSVTAAPNRSNPAVFDNTGGVGTSLSTTGGIVQQFHQSDSSSGAYYMNRTGSTTGKLIQFNYATAAGVTSTTAGMIRLASANSIQIIETSDYRLKENIVDLPNATDRLKAIKPYQYTFKNEPGVIHEGFVAHELQEHSVLTVSGTKDATEAIGTLTDYDGTELETAVVEPSAEELEYTEEVETDGVTTMVTRTKTWTATGTQPVYQGVDQTKLIPLLTKALQEALERIEALEAGGTTVTTRKKK
jgi:hypothetical protein